MHYILSLQVKEVSSYPKNACPKSGQGEQCLSSAKSSAQTAWQPSTSSSKEPNSQFHSAAVQTDTQRKVSLHSTKFYPKLHIAKSEGQTQLILL